MLGVVSAAANMATARRPKEEKEEEDSMAKTKTIGSRDNHPTARLNSDFRGQRLVTSDNRIIHGRNGVGSDWYKDETMAMYL